MKDLLLVLLVLVSVTSISLNFILVGKVNSLRAIRKAEKKMAQSLIKGAVKAASKSQKDIATKDDVNRLLERQIDIARDVVERLENKIKDYEEDIKAANHIHNKLYELLTQQRIVKKVWNEDYVEFYDINRMSVEEIHEIFGHPISA